MAQTSKAAARRGKPSYFMSILGVTIVLFFVGIFGWIFLSASNYIKGLKEDVRVEAYLQPNARQADIDSLQAYIAAKPYTKSIEYVDKEAAKKKWLESGEANFSEFLNENPLPSSIEFHLKGDYVTKDTLANIRADLLQRDQVVQSVNYPSALVEKMGNIVRWILIGLITLAIVFSILSIILIDNTIRLAMYSNRFLIKTMQMVGATTGFISKPMSIRAIINGAIAAVIAIGIIFGLILLFENFLPYLRDLRDDRKLFLLFFILLILGIGITLLSTYRSVLKYLRLKLDELY
ncbi:MAG TPA: permease-like cell division protein FtsX [Flavisolibacter sp.]|nr:permease-like cell division protein FtsX [Flavisolibacter sp.]